MTRMPGSRPAAGQPLGARAQRPSVRRLAGNLASDGERPSRVPHFGASLAALPARASEDTRGVMPRRRPSTAALLGDDKDEHAGEQGTTPVQPSLEVGALDDPFEREADAIAAQTLATPSPAASATATASALDTPLAQRACSECAKEDEPSVRAREASPGPSENAPRLASSDSALSSGGRPLPETTRDFFEERMGRDLSQVRVHEGAQALQLNDSIDARAFTYGNHVWLGPSERADTGFTMAHELAHVLQQTQPGAVAPRRRAQRASSSRAKVRRSGKWLKAFWLPKGVGTGKTDARLHNEKRHDAAMHALADTDLSIIVDAPIPGATGGKNSKNRSDLSGFADFYKATPTASVGVIKTAGVPTPDANPTKTPKFTGVPIKDFPSPLSRVKPGAGAGSTKRPTLGAATYDHRKLRAPTLNGDTVERLKEAPKDIEIGDMKPGHSLLEREKGVSQINNYVETLRNIARLVDAYQDTKGAPRWGLRSVKAMERNTLTIHSDWDPASTTKAAATAEADIELRRRNQILPFKLDSDAEEVKPKVSGRWVAAADQKNAGIFTYFLAPDQASLDTITADPKVNPRFTDVNTKLHELVFKDLLETPKAPAVPMRLPRASSRSARSARRAPRKSRPPAAKDTFNFKQWQDKRLGKGKNDPSSFRGIFNKTFKQEKLGFAGVDTNAQSVVEFQRGVAESLDELKAHFGVERKVKQKDATRIATDAEALHKLEFWSSSAAGVIGRVRQIFGRAFVKIWSLSLKVRAWVTERLKKFQFDGAKKTGGLKGVAMKVGAAMLKVVGGIVLRKTTKAIMDCIELGMQRTMDSLLKEPMESLEAKIKEIETFVRDAESRLLGRLDSMFKSIITPIKSRLEELAKDVGFVGELVGVIKDAIDAARLAVCIAGGLESFGIACAVAAIDKVLSLADLSPIDKIAGALMQSCEAQAIVGKALAASKTMQALPNDIAKAIMGPVRDALPPSLKGFVCEDKDFKIEPFDPKELDCKPGSGGGGDGAREGGDQDSGTGQQDGAGDREGDQEGADGTDSGDGTQDGGRSGAALPVTKAKPFPPGFASKPKDMLVPVILMKGMPTAKTLVVGKQLTVTLVAMREVKGGGYEPAAIVEGVQMKFYAIGEPDPVSGRVPYEVRVAERFYIDVLNVGVYASTENIVLQGVP
jgi:hypothetical protein